MNAIENRYDVIALVEAKMCNPNGDPDAANRPRVDLQTGRGIITDVAFKARMRNYVLDAYSGEEGYNILMQNGTSLNREIAKAVLNVNGVDKITRKDNKKADEAAMKLCQDFWDVRAFGAVLSTGLNAGQVRGAAQVGMSLSVDPVDVNTITITRRCYTEGEFATLQEYDEADANREPSKKRTMGDKTYIPYGLYLFKMTVSANLAQKVGFSEKDLKVLLDAMIQMYDNDASSSKMGMSVVTSVVFKHVGHHTGSVEEQKREALLGCESAYKLFNMLKVCKKADVEYPRDLSDYDIKLDLSNLSDSVECYIKDAAFVDMRRIDTKSCVDLIKA